MKKAQNCSYERMQNVIESGQENYQNLYMFCILWSIVKNKNDTFKISFLFPRPASKE